MIVSRETEDKLTAFAALVQKWNRSINLVAPGTVPELRTRHIADSAAVAQLDLPAQNWADLGSGGGFPGIVVAILRPETTVTLFESDQRKAVFLRSTVRELGLSSKVIAERIEAAAPQSADVVSARALAPLSKLIPLAERHGRPESTYVFPKGARYRAELEAAAREWQFDVDVRPSAVDKESVILLLRNITRV